MGKTHVGSKVAAHDDVMSGGYRSSFRGQGVQFSEHRIYVPGDDVRHIDWKVSARTRDTLVKKFEEERELRGASPQTAAYVPARKVIGRGRPMSAGPPARKKVSPSPSRDAPSPLQVKRIAPTFARPPSTPGRRRADSTGSAGNDD